MNALHGEIVPGAPLQLLQLPVVAGTTTISNNRFGELFRTYGTIVTCRTTRSIPALKSIIYKEAILCFNGAVYIRTVWPLEFAASRLPRPSRKNVSLLHQREFLF